MEDPLVSIVVVSYNHSKYIRENLDSIKAQTYPNIELIVADDASPDNSVEVFEKWLAENTYPAKKNYHTKNTGLATMLNECTEMITGKYVKFIAADDFLHPHSIEKCVRKLEELGEEYGMVFTDTFAVNENSEIEKDIADYNALGMISKEAFRKSLLTGNKIAALTVLMSKKALDSTGAYDSKFLAEDYYRWLKISAKFYIGYVPEKLAYYRLHSENISIAKRKKIAEEVLELQLMFDKDGTCKNIINSDVLRLYLRKNELNKNIKSLYVQYPYHTKRLSWAIKYNLPVSWYKTLNNFI